MKSETKRNFLTIFILILIDIALVCFFWESLFWSEQLIEFNSDSPHILSKIKVGEEINSIDIDTFLANTAELGADSYKPDIPAYTDEQIEEYIRKGHIYFFLEDMVERKYVNPYERVRDKSMLLTLARQGDVEAFWMLEHLTNSLTPESTISVEPAGVGIVLSRLISTIKRIYYAFFNNDLKLAYKERVKIMELGIALGQTGYIRALGAAREDSDKIHREKLYNADKVYSEQGVPMIDLYDLVAILDGDNLMRDKNLSRINAGHNDEQWHQLLTDAIALHEYISALRAELNFEVTPMVNIDELRP